jgi:propanediol utilization protein
MKINTSEQIRWFINNLSKKYPELPVNVSIKIDLDKENYEELFKEFCKVQYPKEFINEGSIIGEYCGVKVFITNKK